MHFLNVDFFNILICMVLLMLGSEGNKPIRDGSCISTGIAVQPASQFEMQDSL